MSTEYLLNPSGSVVEIDDEEIYAQLLKKNFRVPTETQISEYKRLRDAQYAKMTQDPNTPVDVYFASVSPGKNGYGVAADGILRSFDEIGVKYSEAQKGQKIGFLFHAPYSITRLDNPIKVVYTMFESTKIPGEWKEYLDAADIIIVPSHYCMEVFAQAGYNTIVIPLGFNDALFKFFERPPLVDRPFTFLHYDAFNIRKGHLEVFKAFLKAFAPDEPVRLVFKTTKDVIPLPMPPSEYPNIDVITGACTDEALVELLHNSDAFVFPSRGEGFGMTPLEAMATGLPVIVPNAHGIAEYFNAEYMYEVKTAEVSPAIYARYKNQDVGTMVTCDVDDLARQMRYIYEHQGEAQEKGRKASVYAQNWTFTKTAVQLKQLFNELIAKELPSQKVTNILPLEER